MSKKNKKDKTVVDLYTQPIYGLKQLVVIVSNNIQCIYKHVKPYNEDKCDLDRWSDCDGLTFDRVDYKDKPAVCIYLHPAEFSDSVDNVSAHESIHAMFAILQHAGVEASNSSEEAYAYLGGWINECVKNTYNKWLKK